MYTGTPFKCRLASERFSGLGLSPAHTISHTVEDATKRCSLKRKTPLKKRGKGKRFASYVPNKDYQDFVRAHGCWAIQDPNDCLGVVEFDHITTRGAGGQDEGNGWGLCAEHHVERHTLGLKSFAAKYDINPREIGTALWVAWEREQGVSL